MVKGPIKNINLGGNHSKSMFTQLKANTPNKNIVFPIQKTNTKGGWGVINLANVLFEWFHRKVVL